MNKQELVKAFAIATVALLGLLLNTSILLAANADRTHGRDGAQSQLWSWGLDRKRIARSDHTGGAGERRFRRRLQLQSGTRGPVPQGAKEQFRRMDRRTSITAPTMQRIIILCSSTAASW